MRGRSVDEYNLAFEETGIEYCTELWRVVSERDALFGPNRTRRDIHWFATLHAARFHVKCLDDSPISRLISVSKWVKESGDALRENG